MLLCVSNNFRHLLQTRSDNIKQKFPRLGLMGDFFPGPSSMMFGNASRENLDPGASHNMATSLKGAGPGSTTGVCQISV